MASYLIDFQCHFIPRIEIKQNRTIKALQSTGDEALEQAISHPVAKVFVKGVQGFLQS